MRRNAPSLMALSAFVLAAAFEGRDAAGASFTAFEAWQAIDVSGDGSVVVGAGSGSSFPGGFRWTAQGGAVALGGIPPGASSAYPLGVSEDGSVVVGQISLSGIVGPRASRWTADTGWIELGLGLRDAQATSADGSVIVGGDDIGRGFRWTAGGGAVFLGPGRAYGVSADGSVVAGGSDSSPWRWTAAEGTVPLMPSYQGGASDVSADGSVLVGEAGPSPGPAWRWTEAGGFVDLGTLPSTYFGGALAVSGDGSVIVGFRSSMGDFGPDTAFIWDPIHGMRDLKNVLTQDYGLDLTGWTLNYPNGISDDGLTIVGSGSDPQGRTQAWIATIPEPGSALLLGAGVLALCMAGRRRMGR